ncbi:uncharacterized protein LOC121385626 [Gigantopelta aegis]|uniref:uncharacterized protein LOC121385626 n=1 Tax=Gigantopelta aegis TaxID=1735272 RepID=UPI001B88CA24|nr:uncharacterized protein LOC121385626 [Gigantopelta aegis]
MKVFSEFCIRSSHICIIIAAGVFVVNVDSQRCGLGPMAYKRVFKDKTVLEDALITKTGITTRVGCIEVCGKSLPDVCTAFVFNQQQQQCKIYKNSLNTLTQVTETGSVGFTVFEETTCPAPPSLPNGKVTYTSVVIGSTATYSCNADYHFFGLGQSSVCETTRAWNGLNGSCRQVFFYNIANPSDTLYDIPVPGLVTAGWKVEAIGTPLDSPRFSFNLFHDDINIVTLHFDVHFKTSGNIVYVTSRTDGSWDQSDTYQTSFPFAPGRQFNLTILETGNGFEITVDGQWHATRKHSVNAQVTNLINLTGDCGYQSVKMFY